MKRIGSAGFGPIGVVLIFVVIIGAAYALNNAFPDFDIGAPETDTTSQQAEGSSSDTITLQPQHGLEASGKASRSYADGTYNFTFSGALPFLEDDGYYEVYLDGPDELLLGRAEKEAATYRLEYESALNLMLYDEVRIVVDGPRDLQNQPIPLPFDILTGTFER